MQRGLHHQCQVNITFVNLTNFIQCSQNDHAKGEIQKKDLYEQFDEDHFV